MSSVDAGEQPPRVNDYLMFLAALAILVTILWLGYSRESLQYNIIFSIALSLSCAIVIAFIPFTAQFAIQGWFRATGAAAIFAVCVWQTVPFAKEVIKANYENTINTQNTTIATLNTTIKSLTEELGQARKVAANPGSAEAKASLKLALGQASQNLTAMSSRFAAGIALVKAAQSNSSDAGTCSLRSKQALDQIGDAPAIITANREFLDRAVNLLP